MKKIVNNCSSHVKDRKEIANGLKSLKNIPKGALLFTSDARSMYTNIDTRHALHAFSGFFERFSTTIPSDFSIDLFLSVLEIVMENNVFEFGKTLWLQCIGTAMGTNCACNYATISYGYHEETYVLPKFQANLIYYKRYIDDVIGIWYSNDPEKRNQFKSSLNGFGRLT